MDPSIHNYLRDRLNWFFAPFSDDFDFDVWPSNRRIAGAGTGGTSGGDATSMITAPSSLTSSFSRTPIFFGGASMDVKDKDEEYDVSVDLPGIKKEDITVDYRDGMLTIQAERKNENKREGDRYFYAERSYGKIKRQMALPNEVDLEKVHAAFENGVLNLKLPKKQVKKEEKKMITIN